MPSVERRARVAASVTGLPRKVIVPLVGWMHAGENLDQRRFAGAVVADQRDDFAGVDVEVDVGQRRDRAKVLGDAAQAENRLGTSAEAWEYRSS